MREAENSDCFFFFSAGLNQFIKLIPSRKIVCKVNFEDLNLKCSVVCQIFNENNGVFKRKYFFKSKNNYFWEDFLYTIYTFKVP